MTESTGSEPTVGGGSEPSGPAWSQADEDYLSAAGLAAWLRGGQGLLPIQSFIALRPGEMVYYHTDFTALVFSQTAVRYNTGWFAAFGSPAWLAASIAGSAAYNSYQRSKAQAEAAAQWRLADQGSLHVTSQRICLQGRLKWTDIPLSDIRALEAHPDGVIVNRLGQSPVKIATPAVAYLYVLLSFLIHGNAIDVPIPEDLATRAATAGRAVPLAPPTARQVPGPGPAWHPFAAGATTPTQQAAPPGAGALSAWNSPVTPKKVDALGRDYADWGTRATAWVIDALAVVAGWVVFILLIWFGASLTRPDQYGGTSINGAGTAVIVLSVLGLVGWTVWYHMLVGRESGQTPGKRAVAIQVRDATTGGGIGYPRALGRYLLQIFAALILPILVVIDLLWPLWDDRHQTLHDKAVNSVVVKLERPS